MMTNEGMANMQQGMYYIQCLHEHSQTLFSTTCRIAVIVSSSKLVLDVARDNTLLPFGCHKEVLDQKALRVTKQS